MDQFAVKVFVRLRPSVLDPAGEATKSASIKLGAEGIRSLRIGKMIEVIIEGNGENEVREKIDLNYLFDFNFKKEAYKEFLTEDHDHNHIELVSDSIKLNYFLEKNDFEKEMSKILEELNVLRIKGRIWIPNKSLPLQIQIVGKKINTWFEEAPDHCWRPKDNAGLELVIISFDEKSIKIFNKKIKEKFKILSDPKIRI